MRKQRLHASKRFALRAAFACYLLVAGSSAGESTWAFDLEGFTEPYRTIKVAADETGTIAEVFVREGRIVKVGQPLARLNSTIHQTLLAIAEQNMNAEGRLDAARADLDMKMDRLEKLKPLLDEGYARQEEVDRATNEVQVAEANLRTAQEDLATRRLEYEKTKAQIAQRTIRAPIDGVITEMHKDVGEFVAPNSPDILTLVQLDQLLANFTLTSSQASKLKLDEEIDIRFVGGLKTTGVVEFISPVTNAESGTVLVKIRIENAKRLYRSGERCRMRVGG